MAAAEAREASDHLSALECIAADRAIAAHRAAAIQAAAHVLGIVREPMDWFRPTTALARPLLQATLSMVAAAIHASKKTLQAAHIVSRRRIQLHRALEHVRYHTWTHLKPAGTLCRCCAPPGSLALGVHVRRSRRPVDGAKALRAVAQREGQRINGPARLESLKVYARRISSEATQQSARSQREYFTRLGVSDKHSDALDACATVCLPLPQGQPISVSTAPRECGPVASYARLPRSLTRSSRSAITRLRCWSLSLACLRNSKQRRSAYSAVGVVYLPLTATRPPRRRAGRL